MNDEALSVVAHSLLGSMAAIGLTAAIVAERADLLAAAEIAELLGGIASHVHRVTDVLRDLVRTGDPELVATLCQL